MSDIRGPRFVILPRDPEPTWPQLLDSYRDLVEDVEEGYGWNIYEYTNDLSCRLRLQQRLDAGGPAACPAPELLEELTALDARLRAVLVPTRGSIHGRFPSHHFWFYGVPRNAPEVLEDARSLGLLP
ncbi:MAG: hypothetical protein ACJ8AO_04865 [Gemmatimonadaceae bacterium]